MGGGINARTLLLVLVLPSCAGPGTALVVVVVVVVVVAELFVVAPLPPAVGSVGKVVSGWLWVRERRAGWVVGGWCCFKPESDVSNGSFW